MSVYQLNCNYRVISLGVDFLLTTYINTQDMPNAHRDDIYDSIFYKSGRQFNKLSDQEQRDSRYNVDFVLDQFVTPVNFDDINDIKDRVNLLPYTCSVCSGFNRSWNCCGQFAPYFYIYYFFLKAFNYNYNGTTIDFNTFYSNLHVLGQKPSKDDWLKNIAAGFYKIFTSYGASTGNGRDLQYLDSIQRINNHFRINIKSIHDNPGYWLATNIGIDDNAYHLFVLQNKRGGIAHFGFILKRDNFVIICDSWTHDMGYYDNTSQWVRRVGSRSAVTRAIPYDEYLGAVSMINDFYEHMPQENHPSYTKLLYMYNFAIDSLFLIPYHYDSISDGDLTCKNNNELCKFYLVNNNSINSVLELIITNPDFYNAFIQLGGNKKEKKNTKLTKKRTNKKRKTHRKKSTN